MTPDDLDLAELQAAHRLAWSLFVALEHDDQGTIDSITQTTDRRTLLRGWGVVAMHLRKALREHGQTLGCGCGSDAWLEAERYRIAGKP